MRSGLILAAKKEHLMAQLNPDDPYRRDPLGTDPRTPAQLDADLQADPEIREGAVTGTRVAIFAVAIVLVFGAVFYGMNMSSTSSNGPAVATQSTPSAPQNSPSAAPGVRDVTPRNAQTNTQPGVTTGAAPSRPAGADSDR